MYLLVTGVAGFIGSNYIKFHLSKYKNDIIIGIDKLTYAGNMENLNILTENERKRLIFIKGDINNKELLEYIFIQYNIDAVINFAAETHVDNSIKDSTQFLYSNVNGTHSLLNVCKKYWYDGEKWENNKKYVQISTDEVYGQLKENEDGFIETHPLDPRNPYSASKASADLIVKSYYDTYGMPINITRCSNNYGQNQNLEKFIPKIIYNALNHKNIPIYGDGKQIRDWLYVIDHCRAIDLVLKNGIIGNIYNIGGINEIKNIELVKIILSYLSEISNDESINNDLIVYVKDRLGHDRRYAINPNKIMNELQWKPSISFDKGIKLTIDWYYKKYNEFDHV